MSVSTSYLGQFTWENSNAIAAELEQAGIGWSYKQSSRLMSMFFAGEWGVRIFVDSEKLEEAKGLVAELLADSEGQD